MYIKKHTEGITFNDKALIAFPLELHWRFYSVSAVGEEKK